MVDFLDNLRDELVSSIYSSLFRERSGQWAARILKIIIIMWAHLQRDKPYLQSKDGEEN